MQYLLLKGWPDEGPAELSSSSKKLSIESNKWVIFVYIFAACVVLSGIDFT